jgi:hypothetical protein
VEDNRQNQGKATPPGVFRSGWDAYNRPGRIVTFGPYLAANRLLEAHGQLRYALESQAGYQAVPSGDLRRAVRWTRWITALNDDRRWPIDRLFERIDPALEEGVALAVVPSHDPFLDDPPIRRLARRLAENGARIDATGCLVRHTKIRRIVWGGPSYRALHRDTIALHDPELVAGRRVLLLDDVAKSGASLRACEELLYEAGAAFVQMLALGRVS